MIPQHQGSPEHAKTPVHSPPWPCLRMLEGDGGYIFLYPVFSIRHTLLTAVTAVPLIYTGLSELVVIVLLLLSNPNPI